jgi:hypothetical protein
LNEELAGSQASVISPNFDDIKGYRGLLGAEGIE